MLKKSGKAVVLIVLAVIVASCAFEPDIGAAKAKPKLNKSKVSIKIGQKYRLKVKHYKKKVKWSTSNKKIATVKKGLVKAKKKGKCTITAKAGRKKLKCKVTVKARAKFKFDDFWVDNDCFSCRIKNNTKHKLYVSSECFISDNIDNSYGYETNDYYTIVKPGKRKSFYFTIPDTDRYGDPQIRYLIKNQLSAIVALYSNGKYYSFYYTKGYKSLDKEKRGNFMNRDEPYWYYDYDE